VPTPVFKKYQEMLESCFWEHGEMHIAPEKSVAICKQKNGSFLETCMASCKDDQKSLRNLSLGSGIFVGISFAHHFRKRLHDDEWTIFCLRRCHLMAGAWDQRHFLRETMFMSMVFPI
jgi:hypothetical protein